MAEYRVFGEKVLSITDPIKKTRDINMGINNQHKMSLSKYHEIEDSIKKSPKVSPDSMK